jgi:hypothetical protein
VGRAASRFTSGDGAPIPGAGRHDTEADGDDMNWLPDDYHRPEAETPTDGAGTTDATSCDGTPPAALTGPAGGLPDLSPVALAAGVVGLLAGPLLVGDPTARYVILVADIVALAFGALGVWVSLRRFARLDYAVAAIVMGGISLFLWVRYVTDPPQGST